MNPTKLSAAFKAEFLGSLILILLGNGVVASVVLLNKQADWIVITTGWGLAVAFGVYISGRVSGGHLNPAVTLALAIRGEFPWSRVLPYFLAQFLGAFCGALLVYVLYIGSFREYDNEHHALRGQLIANDVLPDPAAGGSGVFCTYPVHRDNLINFLTEMVATAVLLIGVRAMTDKRNANPPRGLEPLLIGTVVFAIGLSLGGLTGYALNPTRDFGPRCAAFVLGWGSSVFKSHSYYFWVPIAGPFVGAILGLLVYDNLIGKNLPDPETPSPPGEMAD